MQTLPTQLYSAAQSREIDCLAQQQSNITGYDLMIKAAMASFKLLQTHYPNAKNIAVVCGAGNNAGDGYLIAMLALQVGLQVNLIALAKPEKLTGDAQRAMQAFIQAGGLISTDIQVIDHTADIIVDALLGTGLDRLVSGEFATAIAHINALTIPVLAIDIPSGLNADTGNIMGCAVYANLTITFIVLKKGLFTGLAADYCGKIAYADLDIPASIIQSTVSDTTLLSTPTLAKRHASAHKGQFGHVWLVGGDYGYAGAIHLAAEAALNTGAGLVSVATRKQHAQLLHLSSLELMGHGVEQVEDLANLKGKATVLVLGPGLGQGEWGKSLWAALIQLDLPRVIDADALNLLAKQPSYSDSWVLTPHPGEAARLLNCSTADILDNRYQAVRSLQQKYGGVCVLKGAGSLVCAGEQVYVNTTGNPGMATGGMGDVLAGLIASLLAQNYALLEATKIAVYLHGLAADKAVEEQGERGLRASDVLQFLRKVVN